RTVLTVRPETATVPVITATAAAGRDMDERTERFIERMGQFFEAEAGPRIAGRLFGLLLLSPVSLSLDEIAERLQVSKASVSANARMLEQLNVIGRLTRPGDRRDYYAVTEDTQRRLIELRLQ